MLQGQKVSDLSKQSGIYEATLHRWKSQAKVDSRLKAGIKSYQVDDLAKACKKIQDLQEPLKITKDACDLFNSEAKISPKNVARS